MTGEREQPKRKVPGAHIHMAFGEHGRVTATRVLQEADGPTVSDAVAENIRQARKRRGWKPADLAARCGEIGAAWVTENVIENIEGGRRRNGERTRDVTIDELVAIAYALAMPPTALCPELGEGVGDLSTSLFNGIDDMIARLEELRNRLPASPKRDDGAVG